MVTILYWHNGDWAFEHEVWRPEEGYQTARVSSYWPDERVTRFVTDLLRKQAEHSPDKHNS